MSPEFVIIRGLVMAICSVTPNEGKFQECANKVTHRVEYQCKKVCSPVNFYFGDEKAECLICSLNDKPRKMGLQE